MTTDRFTIDDGIREAETVLEECRIRLAKLQRIKAEYPDAVRFELPNGEIAYASTLAHVRCTGIDLSVLQMSRGSRHFEPWFTPRGQSGDEGTHRFAVYAELPSMGEGWKARCYSPLPVDAKKAFAAYNDGDEADLISALLSTTGPLLAVQQVDAP